MHVDMNFIALLKMLFTTPPLSPLSLYMFESFFFNEFSLCAWIYLQLNFHIVEGIKRLNTGPEACF